MKTFFSFFGIVSLCLVTSCASVGGAWNAGTEIVTGTVDSVVGGAATMAVAITDDARNIADVTIDTAQGVVVAGGVTSEGGFGQGNESDLTRINMPRVIYVT